MNRIICTTQEEKRQWMEASEFLNNKLKDSNLPMIKFLQGIYREPGNVEIQESGVVIPTQAYGKRKFKESKPPVNSFWDKLK